MQAFASNKEEAWGKILEPTLSSVEKEVQLAGTSQGLLARS
jgi:hypothetical protein